MAQSTSPPTKKAALHLNGIITIATDVCDDKAQLQLMPFVNFHVGAAMESLEVMGEILYRSPFPFAKKSFTHGMPTCMYT